MTEWLERQRHLVDHTLASMARRRGRNLALFLVYALVVFLLASALLAAEALRREAGRVLAGAPEVLVQRLAAGRHDLIPGSYAGTLAGIRGVQGATPRLWGYFYDPVVQANYTVMVPPEREVAAGTVVIGPGIARTRGAAPGDLLSLRGAAGEAFAFRVAGVLDPDEALVAADLMLVSAADYRAFFGVAPGRYTDIALTVRNPREVRTVAEKVTAALPDTRPILREEILRTYDAVFPWRSGVVLVLLTGAVLAFAIFAFDRAAGLSAEERREIGILKAVGWDTGDVIAMKLWEGALVSLGAFLAGYLAAWVHVFQGGAGLFTPVLRGWAVLYPDFRPLPFVDPVQVLSLFLLTVLPYTLATLVPVWRAATVDPDAVMRGAPP